MSTTVSRMQQLLEALAAASPAVETESKAEQQADYRSALSRTKTAGWDPYEVWLTRVQAPRQGQRNHY